MSDDNPAITASIEAAIQSEINQLAQGVMLTEWVICAVGVRLSEIGERTQMFYLPKPELPLHVTRGLAVSGADYWRHVAEESDE